VEQRQLGTGSAALTVSAVGMGGVAMSGGYGPVTPERFAAVVARAVELGVTLFDTAEYYGGDSGETALGQALRGHRDQVVISTKFGMRRDQTGGPFIDGSPEYIARACEASLARLGTGHIDLYHLARIDPFVPVEESIGAMSELVAEGKVRYLGLCEAGPTTLARAHATHPITAVQTEYSLLERHVEAAILPTARRLGIGFIAYCPLSRGLLAKRFSSLDDLVEGDWRRLMERFQGDAFSHNQRLVDRADQLAATRGASAAQIALAWLLAQGEDVVPIPGTASLQHVEEDVAASSLRLREDEVERLSAGVPAGSVRGLRYPESLMAGINRE